MKGGDETVEGPLVLRTGPGAALNDGAEGHSSSLSPLQTRHFQQAFLFFYPMGYQVEIVSALEGELRDILKTREAIRDFAMTDDWHETQQRQEEEEEGKVAAVATVAKAALAAVK